MRFILEKFADRLGPMVRLLRELRLKQRLTDGLVKVPDAPAELVEFAWQPTSAPLGPGPDGPAAAATGVGQFVDPSVGLRRVPARRARDVDPLPARVDRDGDDSESRRRGRRRRARHADAARPGGRLHAASRHSLEAARRCVRRCRRLRRTADARRAVWGPAEGLESARRRPADSARRVWRHGLAGRRDRRTGRAEVRRELPVAVYHGRQGGSAMGRHVAGRPGRRGAQDLVPDRHAGQPRGPGAGHGRSPCHVLLSASCRGRSTRASRPRSSASPAEQAVRDISEALVDCRFLREPMALPGRPAAAAGVPALSAGPCGAAEPGLGAGAGSSPGSSIAVRRAGRRPWRT